MKTPNLLHPYQVDNIERVLKNYNLANWNFLGSGKTICTLTAIVELMASCEINKTLVAAPKRVCDHTWQDQAADWSHTKHLRIVNCTGTLKQRQAALMQQGDIYLINHDNIPWLVKQYYRRWPFDFIVLDEAHNYKNASAQRFKAMLKVVQAAYGIGMVQLTATPAPQGEIDLWAQIALLDQGKALGANVTAFRDRFFSYNPATRQYACRDWAVDMIRGRIKHLTHVVDPSDHIELPEVTEQVYQVNLSPKHQQMYDDLTEHSLIDFKDYDPESTADPIAALHEGSLPAKQLQFANGALYDDGRVEYCHSAKLEALEEIVADNPNDNLIVAYWFKFDLDMILSRFPHAKVFGSEPGLERQWNDGEIKMLLLHPTSDGAGINLQRGGRITVWYSLTWNLIGFQQLNGRTHRQGQLLPCHRIYIVTAKTRDVRLLPALRMKGARQDDILNAMVT